MVALISLVLLGVGSVGLITARDLPGMGMAAIPLGISLLLALSL